MLKIESVLFVSLSYRKHFLIIASVFIDSLFLFLHLSTLSWLRQTTAHTDSGSA